MILCEYGCGQRAKYQFKNGKWCCSNHWLRCPEQKKRYKGKNNPFYHKTHTKEVKKRLRKASSGKNNPWYGKKRLEHSKRMKGNIPGNKLTINQINNRYPFFSQIEEQTRRKRNSSTLQKSFMSKFKRKRWVVYTNKNPIL